ncbi:MAG: GerMN domain-containing protein [Ilumatobacteraceae bacterium]
MDIWLVRDDELVTTRHLIEAPATAQAALTELLAGPTSAEQERSLRSAIPDASVVIDVELLRGVATVDLSPSFSDIPAQDQVFAVGQIVLTMTDLRGVGRVRFVVDDAQIAVPLPSGDTSEDTVSREDYLAMADNSA